MSSQHRFVLLDGLRGIAAFAVVTVHYTDDLAGWHFLSGFLAVDIFFVLSGFVLAHAYETRFRAGMSAWGFMKARIVRLYPLYFLGTAAVIFFDLILVAAGQIEHAQEGGDRLRNILLGVAFLPSFSAEELLYPLNFPAWSLFFELVANFLYRASFSVLSTRVLIAVIAAAFLAFCFVGSESRSIDFGTHWEVKHLLGGFVRAGFSFFAGVLLFRLWSQMTYRPRIPAWIPLAALLALLYFAPEKNLQGEYQIIACAMFPAIVFLAACSAPSGAFKQALSSIGTASYGIYVLQIPLLHIASVGSLLAFGVPLAAMAPWSGIGLAIILLAISLFLEPAYDIPARKLLARIHLRRSPA